MGQRVREKGVEGRKVSILKEEHGDSSTDHDEIRSDEPGARCYKLCFRRSCNRLILEADRGQEKTETLTERGGSMKRRKQTQQTDESPGRTRRTGERRGLSATRYATTDPTAQIDKDNKVSDTK